jgi:hypothetical protein
MPIPLFITLSDKMTNPVEDKYYNKNKMKFQPLSNLFIEILFYLNLKRKILKINLNLVRESVEFFLNLNYF